MPEGNGDRVDLLPELGLTWRFHLWQFSGVIDRTRPSRSVVAGLAIGLCGLFLIVGPPVFLAGSASVETGYAVWLAFVLCAAGLTWSIGSLIQKPLFAATSQVWAAGLQTLSAAVVLTALCWTSGTAVLPQAEFAPLQLIAFLYLVIFGSVVSLLAYITVMKIYPPVIASTFAYVNPLVGVVLGWAFLGEKPELIPLVGIALILTGVSVIMVRAQSK